MKCFFCSSDRVVRSGFLERARFRTKRVQRYRCKDCGKTFSDQTSKPSYRSRIYHLEVALFANLCSGVSQRRCARNFGINQKTVARKVISFGRLGEKMLSYSRPNCKSVSTIVFDEMETFEHTKCKPLSIVLAVEDKTRRILSVEVAQMPAKGTLAKIALKKYGHREDHRAFALEKVMAQLRQTITREEIDLMSDLCPRYPKVVRKYFPKARHFRFKGRRGCVVGQGELKRGGFDPLFSLNHSCAMVRDNIKRLSRRTWCTSKDPKRLQDLLNMYACYHNYHLQPSGPSQDLQRLLTGGVTKLIVNG